VVALVALVAVDALPVKGPTNDVAVKDPVTLVLPSISTAPSNEDVPLAFTLKIGIPDISDMFNKSPVKSSVIENN